MRTATDVMLATEPDPLVLRFSERGRRLIDWETFHLADRHEALRYSLARIGDVVRGYESEK